MEQNIIDLIEQHEAEVSALEVARNRAYWEFSTDANRANEERLEATELALKTLFSNRERYARIRAYDSDYRSEVRSTRRQIHLIRLDFLEHQIAEATGVRGGRHGDTMDLGILW